MRQKRISPLIQQNIYADFLFKEAWGDKSEGITIGEKNINNTWYVDDTVMYCENEKTRS